MDPFLSFSRKTPFQGAISGVLLLFLFFIYLPSGVQAVDTWQPVETGSWGQVDIPPGWSSSSGKNETDIPDNVTITANAPDKNTHLTYILEHNRDEMTREGIQKFQSGYMSRLGFRICKTKDPVVGEKEDSLSYRQTYVRGTEDAAVIGTISQPGWGQAHYILVMEGRQAVADYYDSLPEQIGNHIRPAVLDEGKP